MFDEKNFATKYFLGWLPSAYLVSVLTVPLASTSVSGFNNLNVTIRKNSGAGDLTNRDRRVVSQYEAYQPSSPS